MNRETALNDENVPPQVIPTYDTIGHQVKRLKTAIALSEIDDIPEVKDECIGMHSTKVTEMTLSRLFGSPDTLHGQLVAAVMHGIDRACQPNGSISNYIQQACQPNGPISNAFFHAAEIADRRGGCKYVNSLCVNSSSLLSPIANVRILPDNFPATVGDFWELLAPNVLDLLSHYGLNLEGNAPERKNRLAHYCRVNIPID